MKVDEVKWKVVKEEGLLCQSKGGRTDRGPRGALAPSPPPPQFLTWNLI